MSNHQTEHKCDILVIGAGAAGLTLALRLASSANVIVLSKSQLKEGSTYYAQGGIAAVFDEQDSVESHVQDTLIAGAGLCEEAAVRITAEKARESLETLISYGVPFDTVKTDNGEEKYHLTREGGQSHRRILHAADSMLPMVIT